MGSDLARFSVAMPEDLLQALDAYTVRRGTRKNRSEAIRDLVREALVDEQVEDTMAEVVGVLTLVLDAGSRELRSRLDAVQDEYAEQVVSATRMRLDASALLEVVILRGQSWLVRTAANAIMGNKGVLHGQLVVTTVEDPAGHGGHDAGHSVPDHAKPHEHVDAHGHVYVHTH